MYAQDMAAYLSLVPSSIDIARSSRRACESTLKTRLLKPSPVNNKTDL